MPFCPTLSDTPTLDELENALMEGGDYLNGLRRVDADRRNQSWRDDVRSAADMIRLLDGMHTAFAERSRGPVAATVDDGERTRTLGDQVVNAQGFEEFRVSGRAAATFFETEVRALIDSTTDAEWVPVAPTKLPPILRQRAVRIRDLLSVQTTGLQGIPYIRENYATNGQPAGFTAEGGQKNEVEITWESDDAPVRKITAWVPVTTEIISDAPTLRGYIDNRLVNQIAIAEDNALLAGPGTGATLKGILSFSGLQAVTASELPTWQVGAANRFEKLALAIGKIEAVDGTADGIAMHPLDFWTMVSERHAAQFTGGTGNAVSPFGSQYGLDPWGLPVARTTAITQGTAVVGAWKEAATLFDREQVTVRVGNQHSDFFTSNKVAVLAEERIALAVHRPDLFVTVPINAVAQNPGG